jgi:glycosyltransferase involved in cell wall biosynthesis
VLVFVGSLKPWHGIEFLLRAHAEGALGDVALWVVGDGPMREHVEAAVAADPARIRFEGPVRHEAVAAILRASDAALAPYLDSAPDYFCPLKAFEAMCVGVPLLAAAVPAITHLENYGSRIHLFEPGSARSLGKAWERCRQSTDSRGIDAQAHTWDARVRELSSLVGFGLNPVGASA